MTAMKAGNQTFAPLVGLFGILATLASCGPAEAPPPEAAAADGLIRLTTEQITVAGVTAEPVVLEQVATQVDVPATVASPDTAMAAVGSLVEGRIESVAVLPGDAVEAGAPLVFLHSHELTDAQRDLASAEAKLAFAEAALGRSDELLSEGAVSREEAQRRRAERDALAAEVARAREWIDHLSPDAEGRVVIRAPRSGIVFDVSAHPGAGVNPGDPLVTLGRTDVLWATGWIPEQESLLVAPGDEVSVRFRALPDHDVTAHVVRMGGSVDPVRRAVQVRAELTWVPEGVRPGAFATLILPSSSRELRAIVPAEAVQRVAGGELVFVEEEPGVYRPAPVVSYTLPDGRVAVDGLPDGQRIVVTGAYAVRSAMESTSESEGET
ncbi:MAG: efflux RND transporter periplasmic adaptor subunit [Gemmatimonadota bacterium]|jgi:cobalt-zinc-cadmium efflux system membrane fusion protein